jgi:hypothetical protein
VRGTRADTVAGFSRFISSLPLLLWGLAPESPAFADKKREEKHIKREGGDGGRLFSLISFFSLSFFLRGTLLDLP